MPREIKKLTHLSCLIPGVSVHVRTEIHRNGQRKTVEMKDLAWKETRELTGTAWRIGEGQNLKMQLWWQEDAKAARDLHAGVTAIGGWTLSTVVFEVCLRVTDEDSLSWPFAIGAIVPVKNFEKEKCLELTYPVYGSMQWMDVFGKGRGVYVGAHDDAPWFKHLRAQVEKSGKHKTLILEVLYTDLEWSSGKEWSAPPLCLAEHEGDWREGSRIYRAWADTWFRHEPVPEFLKKTCGHNMISALGSGERFGFKALPGLARQSRELGIDGVHIADYMEEGFDTFYPAFQPDPKLGGEEGLRKALREMEAEGTWTCLYTNGRIMDPSGPYGSHAFEWAAKHPPEVKKRLKEMWERTQDKNREGWDPGAAVPEEPAPFNLDGTAAQEWWGRIFTPQCPSVPGWRELWLSRVTDLAKKIHPRMFQVDQVCGCWGMPCYDSSHPHASPALAWSGYKEFMREMRLRVKAIDPGIGFWTEGVNDILGQSFDGLQAHMTFDSLLAGIGDWDARLFKCTFPEFILVTGDLNGKDPWATAWAILMGGHYHFCIPNFDRLDEGAKERVRFAARVRTKYWRYFTSHEVFCPEVTGHDRAKVLAYRNAGKTLLVGAIFEEGRKLGHEYRIKVSGISGNTSVKEAEWMDGTGKTSLKKGTLEVRGGGLFLVLLS